MGAEHPYFTRQKHGLDGAYVRAGGRRLHRCHPRHDLGSGIAPLLPLYYALRLAKICALCKNVWHIDPAGKSDEAVAAEGLEAMKAWMQEIGVTLSLSELGATEEMIDGIADATLILEGGYKVLNKEEVKAILKESLYFKA